jgi:diadenosine tetraphosphate (Ap4A) HIT family hydrolase
MQLIYCLYTNNKLTASYPTCQQFKDRLAKIVFTGEHVVMFKLHPRLESDCIPVREMTSSQLLLMGDARYPWFILVPTIPDIRELHDLAQEDLQHVLNDMMIVSKAVKKIYNPDKINIGALGNIVDQLHIHIIARFINDDTWPGPVWGYGNALHYEEAMLVDTIEFMNETLEQPDLK